MRKLSLEYVYKLACENERIVYIGSDVGAGTLDDFKQQFPDRFFMEGISEQHIIGMAAGLALEGYIPYVNTIATFLTRRCYEQLAIDVCLQNLPIRLIGNGGGLVYAPLGPTHLAIDDIALMRALPNMQVVAVADEEEMRRLMAVTADISGPLYIRVGKGNEPVIYKDEYNFQFGQASIWKEPKSALIISTGIMSHLALEIAHKFDQVGIMHMHTIEPFDSQAVIKYAKQVDLIITLEEHILNGGLGSAVMECLLDNNVNRIPKVKRYGIKNRFPKGYGSQQEMIDNEIVSRDELISFLEKYYEHKNFFATI
jgi:transketolase